MEFLNGADAAKELGYKTMGRAFAKHLGIPWIDGPENGGGRRTMWISRESIEEAKRRKKEEAEMLERVARDEDAGVVREYVTNASLMTKMMVIETKLDNLLQQLNMIPGPA